MFLAPALGVDISACVQHPWQSRAGTRHAVERKMNPRVAERSDTIIFQGAHRHFLSTDGGVLLHGKAPSLHHPIKIMEVHS